MLRSQRTGPHLQYFVEFLANQGQAFNAETLARLKEGLISPEMIPIEIKALVASQILENPKDPAAALRELTKGSIELLHNLRDDQPW